MVLLQVRANPAAQVLCRHGLAHRTDVVALALDPEQRHAAYRATVDALALPLEHPAKSNSERGAGRHRTASRQCPLPHPGAVRTVALPGAQKQRAAGENPRPLANTAVSGRCPYDVFTMMSLC